ncbi:MAG: TIGR00341 family protein, partial [Candidatus Omnitrophica bacterium]|nr:TIGR00341 family protein [Candidatus Omnitrophota bacterium]
MVIAKESSHIRTAISLGGRLCNVSKKKLAIVSIVDDDEEEEMEATRREIMQAARDAGVDQKQVRPVVFSREEGLEDFIKLTDNQGLVLVDPDSRKLVRQLLDSTTHPTVGVVKRAPPLKTMGWKSTPTWVPRLSPADYADLIHTLRTGSKLSVDFLSMLAAAAVIATFGLLQDSPAVVIGSMLLAPLMTPMIGNGLALAQANAKLGKESAQSIVVGFLMTLAISFCVAMVTPGKEMTSQVIARGDPNLLDLGVAVFSSIAAAYALARPNIVGAVAGVAIATALVPPLCSVGISFAYKAYDNAVGAALLFFVNVVAIILGAAMTFRMLGVTGKAADKGQQRWVYRTVGLLILTVIVLAIPLERKLEAEIRRGKSQPSTFPLTVAVMDELNSFIDTSPGVELVAAGRSSQNAQRVNIVLS